MVTSATSANSDNRLSHARRRAPHANPPRPSTPGSRIAHATWSLPWPGWEAGVAKPTVPADCVCTTIELNGGHAEAGDPAGQVRGVFAEISTLPGLKVHDAWLGSPEQERVTNIGDVSAVGFTGLIVTFTVPAAPAVSTRGSADGATAASVN